MKFSTAKFAKFTKKPVGEHAVHYRAKSAASSGVIWFNVISALAAILAMPELVSMIGPDGAKYVAFAIGAVNVVLRFWVVRPVAVVAPGKTKTVAVHKL